MKHNYLHNIHILKIAVNTVLPPMKWIVIINIYLLDNNISLIVPRDFHKLYVTPYLGLPLTSFTIMMLSWSSYLFLLILMVNKNTISDSCFEPLTNANATFNFCFFLIMPLINCDDQTWLTHFFSPLVWRSLENVVDLFCLPLSTVN